MASVARTRTDPEGVEALRNPRPGRGREAPLSARAERRDREGRKFGPKTESPLEGDGLPAEVSSERRLSSGTREGSILEPPEETMSPRGPPLEIRYSCGAYGPGWFELGRFCPTDEPGWLELGRFPRPRVPGRGRPHRLGWFEDPSGRTPETGSSETGSSEQGGTCGFSPKGEESQGETRGLPPDRERSPQGFSSRNLDWDPNRTSVGPREVPSDLLREGRRGRGRGNPLRRPSGLQVGREWDLVVANALTGVDLRTIKASPGDTLADATARVRLSRRAKRKRADQEV